MRPWVARNLQTLRRLAPRLNATTANRVRLAATAAAFQVAFKTDPIPSVPRRSIHQPKVNTTIALYMN